MIRIAVVEDEEKYYRVLKGYLDRYEAECAERIEVVWFENGAVFLEQFHSDFDIILLDIEMPVMDGLSVARDVRKADDYVIIIFITNMAQYAIHGYEVNALDYVVKPVEYYPFLVKLQRAVRIIRETSGNSLLLPFLGEEKRVLIKEILYVEVHSHTVDYYTYSGVSTVTGTLKTVEERLKNDHFVRCNSCYLVNLRHVTGIKDDAVIVEGHSLKISRAKKKEFLNQLSVFYSEVLR